MNISIKKAVYTPLFLKFSSIIIGYSLWLLISYHSLVIISYSAPLYFYNTQDITINAPEEITLTLKGPKKILYSLNHEDVALYINVQSLPKGSFPLSVTKNNIYLPSNISLIEYKPPMILIKDEIASKAISKTSSK